jgi:hypothetical protein
MQTLYRGRQRTRERKREGEIGEREDEIVKGKGA